MGCMLEVGGAQPPWMGPRGGSGDPPMTGGPIQGRLDGVPTCHRYFILLHPVFNSSLWAHGSLCTWSWPLIESTSWSKGWTSLELCCHGSWLTCGPGISKKWDRAIPSLGDPGAHLSCFPSFLQWQAYMYKWNQLVVKCLVWCWSLFNSKSVDGSLWWKIYDISTVNKIPQA